VELVSFVRRHADAASRPAEQVVGYDRRVLIARGKKVEELDVAALRAAIAGRRVVVDLGAGDGRWAYRHASSRPDEFVIGIDPVAENMREVSARAARRERGGADNVLFSVASVERVPPELLRIADEVQVTLPWGSLMRGLITGDAAVLTGVASLAKPGARVRIVLNTRIFDDPVPLDARDLPEATPEHVRGALAEPYARAGLRLIDAGWMDADAVAALETTWGKRLSHRRPPRSLLIVAERT
jgi:16S rRNA (adenine(1408)-N(1))-methyltransferase